MSSDLRSYSARMVGMLLIVEAVLVYFLWALNPVNEAGEAVYAIFLAIMLVAGAMISYIYRTYKSGDQFNRAFLLGSCVLVLILVYASMAL